MQWKHLGMILTCATLVAARRVEPQAERIRAMVTAAQADKAACVKSECLSWHKPLHTPYGVIAVTRCGTSPSQQIEVGLAARMLAKETNNPAWNDLAVTAVASAFIHDPPSYSVVQADQDGVIAELDARIARGEYGGTLRPGGAKDFLVGAARWASQPQCTR